MKRFSTKQFLKILSQSLDELIPDSEPDHWSRTEKETFEGMMTLNLKVIDKIQELEHG